MTSATIRWPSKAINAVRFTNFEKIGVSDLFYADRQIAELGRREKFEVLNLAPALQSYAEAHHVFLHGFKNTPMGFGHWNEAGHEQAGRLIAAKLCQMMTQSNDYLK